LLNKNRKKRVFFAPHLPTIFEGCCKCGETSIVKIFLDSGFDAAQNQNFAIVEACRIGKLDLVNLLLTQSEETKNLTSKDHKKPVVDPSAENNSAIIAASQYGHAEVVKVLLKDKRVSPADQNSKALGVAIDNDHFQVVKLLVDDGRTDANPYVDYVFKQDKIKFWELIKPRVHNSVIEKNINFLIDFDSGGGLTSLIENKKIDPGKSKQQYLKLAAQKGSYNVIEVLLKCPQVDPTVDKCAPLCFAADKGFAKVVALLLRNQEVNPMTNKNAPLVLAAQNAHIDVIKILLDDPRVEPLKFNNDALAWAAKRGHLDVIKELLKDKRFDAAANGNEALKWAEKYNHEHVANFLLTYPKVQELHDKKMNKKFFFF